MYIDIICIVLLLGSFLPLRVTDDTPELGKAGFIGHLRWLLYVPAFSWNIVSTPVREQNNIGMIASFW